MKLSRIIAGCVLASLFTGYDATFAEDAPSTMPPPKVDVEAAYLADISKRADKILATLDIKDEAASARVQALIRDQYKNLRAVHDPRDAALKEAKGDEAKTQQIKVEADAKIKVLHDEYLANLAKDLSPEQVTQVKDGMTSNKVNVTYNAYLDQIPRLTDPQKLQIRTWLEEAREIAMDQGSSKEKDNVFGKYKGKIGNFLAKEGYNMKEEEKAWMERIKARKNSTTQPAN